MYVHMHHLLVVGMRFTQPEHLLPFANGRMKLSICRTRRTTLTYGTVHLILCRRLIKRVRDPMDTRSLFLAESRGHATDSQTEFLEFRGRTKSSAVITANCDTREIRSLHFHNLFLEHAMIN